MISWNAVEREEQEIERQFAEGEITIDEYHKAMRALRDDIRGAAEEAAEQAYRDTMGDW